MAEEEDDFGTFAEAAPTLDTHACNTTTHAFTEAPHAYTTTLAHVSSLADGATTGNIHAIKALITDVFADIQTDGFVTGHTTGDPTAAASTTTTTGCASVTNTSGNNNGHNRTIMLII